MTVSPGANPRHRSSVAGTGRVPPPLSVCTQPGITMCLVCPARSELTAMKEAGTLAFGQVPALIVDGCSPPLAQSKAIIRYVRPPTTPKQPRCPQHAPAAPTRPPQNITVGAGAGRAQVAKLAPAVGLYPEDPLLAARVDALVDQTVPCHKAMRAPKPCVHSPLSCCCGQVDMTMGQSIANYKGRFGFAFLAEEEHKPLLDAAQERGPAPRRGERASAHVLLCQRG